MNGKITFMLAFLATLLIGLLFYISEGNATLLFFLNMNHRAVLDFFFKYITHLGDGLFFGIMAVFLLFKNRTIGISFTLMGVVQAIISWFLKHQIFTNSPRPKGVYGTNFINLVEGVAVHSHHSFPSGHTMTAFAIAGFIAFWLNKKSYSLLLLTLATLAGLSRIYLFQHFLIDTLFGALVGVLLAYFAWKFTPKPISK